MGRKIAFIHPDLGIGGAERLILDIAIALKEQGHHISFLTNHYDESHSFDDLKNDAFNVTVFGDWMPCDVFGFFQALCAYVRMAYLTIVYLFFTKKKDLADLYIVDLFPIAIPFLKLSNCKVVYYCHHPDLLASKPGGFWKKLYRRYIDWVEMKSTSLSDYILVNSDYTASVFKATFPNIRQNLQVLYPTISYQLERNLQSCNNSSDKIYELIPSLPKNSDNFIFLSINRFHPAKRIDLGILALRELLNSQPSAHVYFIVAGGYDMKSAINAQYYEELKQLVNSHELQDQIIFVKSPSDSMKLELLLGCHCIIYTPVKEHFGIVPLEAMAASKAVIACDSGGPKETVIHENTGYLCKPNAVSMSNYMKQIMDNNNYQKMGRDGKKIFTSRFSHSVFSKRITTIFNTIR